MGNAQLSAPFAGIVSGFLLTTLLLFARGIARSLNLQKNGRYIMFIYYWIAGSASIWIVARIAVVSGFGIARFYWAIGLGIFIALAHWTLRQAFKGIKLI